MRRGALLLTLFAALLGVTNAAFAADARLQDLRLWAAPERTRVVLDLTEAFEHTLFTLDNPPRVVVDVADAAGLGPAFAALEGKGFVTRVRTGVRQGGDLRVVLDLKDSVEPSSFTMTPKGDYGHRLVLDLETGDGERDAIVEEEVQPEIVVAVDAGHGGEDPGATGPGGTLEKDVVFAIAGRLKTLIDAEPAMRAVLIRDGDYYLGLRERIVKARAAQADLFVSIHADAFRQPNARGSSVFVLSRSGASSEHARWLAERENSADLIGGVSLRNKDDDLAAFMLDLSQGASIEASLDVGARILNQIGSINDLHKKRVQQAGFLVLKSPDIPSLLVETAFISNPAEERELNDISHQKHLARAMMEGIRGYFASYRPSGKTVAEARKHTVAPGETLSEIALRYGIGVATLRRINHLDSNMIRVGQSLLIPPPGDPRLASSRN